MGESKWHCHHYTLFCICLTYVMMYQTPNLRQKPQFCALSKCCHFGGKKRGLSTQSHAFLNQFENFKKWQYAFITTKTPPKKLLRDATWIEFYFDFFSSWFFSKKVMSDFSNWKPFPCMKQSLHIAYVVRCLYGFYFCVNMLGLFFQWCWFVCWLICVSHKITASDFRTF